MAEGLASRLKVSRSQLYATALADFLRRQCASNMTEQLNAVYACRIVNLDPALNRAQLRSIDKDS